MKNANAKFILSIVALVVSLVAGLQGARYFNILNVNMMPMLVYVVVYLMAIFGLILSMLAIDDGKFLKGYRLLLILSLAYFYILPYLDHINANWDFKVIYVPLFAVVVSLLTAITLIIDALRAPSF